MSHPEDEDPTALFRAAIGPVAPLNATPPANPKPRPKPRARMAERDDAQAQSEFQTLLRERAPLEAGDIASYRRAHLPARVFQRLRKGQFSAQDELDLHGATATQAEALLRQFLAEAHAHELGCVRIVHGKGLQSCGTPLLKNLVDRLLRQRNDVLAFHSAPPAQGGTGALLVLLARR
ncbi:Smr/MutS family protein [Xanthomonas sp. GPE 39]|uniref:Smr/MutS family protein n=1 Tax=Xanthomonas sp. GPE 39 TaxID=1583099 RepID=UPI0005F2DC4A|nr:Smr/MutS family protein [Xanthomonas sp. GPE 39]